MWEYYTFTMYGGSAMDRLNQLGAEGWELVSAFMAGPTANFILKRPKANDAR